PRREPSRRKPASVGWWANRRRVHRSAYPVSACSPSPQQVVFPMQAAPRAQSFRLSLPSLRPQRTPCRKSPPFARCPSPQFVALHPIHTECPLLLLRSARAASALPLREPAALKITSNRPVSFPRLPKLSQPLRSRHRCFSWVAQATISLISSPAESN